MCKICNVTVDHIRRQNVSDHLQSKRQLEQAAEHKCEVAAGVTPKRQITLTGCVRQWYLMPKKI